MVLALLFGKKYAKTAISSVVLDAVISEDHHYTSRVTNFPIENGLIISDHIINDPETLQITGIVSDTPLALFTPFNTVLNALNAPSVSAFNTLVEIHNRRERITVVTGIKVYDNMVITSFQVPRNMESGQSLTFVIDLQKMILDSTVKYTVNPNNPFSRVPDTIPREQVASGDRFPYIQNDPPDSLKDQASSGVDAGIQQLVPVPPSLYQRLVDYVENKRL